MADDKNKDIIEKMWQAYEEFARYVGELEKEGNNLLKEHLRKIDKEKIDDIMRKIREM